MGYCIEMTESKFTIKKENFTNALNDLKNVFVPENMTTYDYYDGKRHPHFSWVSTESVLESKSLEEALKEIRYQPVFDDAGNICDIEFTGQKYGDEEIFFKALAPHVESGSYLRFKGEDGDTWTWDFDLFSGRISQAN